MPTTSEEKVLCALRKGILSGKFPVGEFLSQRKLAEETDSSVISVRSALRQLENEGLIENIPRWGVRIPKETCETIQDRYLIREVLETFAVEQVCQKLSPQQTKHLSDRADRLELLIENADAKTTAEFAHIHHEFHLYIAQCSNSPLLEKLLQRVINASFMLLNARSTWVNLSVKGISHRELAEVIINGPVRDAVNAMRSHVHTGLHHELESLDGPPTS